MALFSHHEFPHLWRKGCTILLALCFLSGLIFGMFAYISAEETLLPMMRRTFYGNVSIVSLLSVTCLPFLLSAFAVYTTWPGFMLAVSFAKAFVFSFVSLGIYSCIHSAGWFLLWLLIFTDLLSMPVMYFFWLRNLSGEGKLSLPVMVMCTSLVILIVSLYIRFISPFLAQILNS